MKQGRIEMDGEIIRSVLKSKQRVSILRYLWDKYPQKAYLSEITRGIQSDFSNTHGALNGMNNHRWAVELSLVALGLVEKISIKKSTYYKLNSERIQDIQDILNMVNNKGKEVIIDE